MMIEMQTTAVRNNWRGLNKNVQNTKKNMK